VAAVAWVHSLCGKISHFPKGRDPNKGNTVCPKCWVALGQWFEA
jgi:hypothetical protein